MLCMVSRDARKYENVKNVREGTYDWDEVVGDDRQIVPVNTEALDTSRSSINQPQSMRLASGKLEPRKSCVVCAFRVVTSCLGRTVKVHLAVDKVVVRSRLWVTAS